MDLQKHENKKVGMTHFSVEENSNYKVIMTFGREEIVTFEHFKELAKAITTSEPIFITVNKIIVQKKDIRMIEPTKEPTKEQKEAREKDEQYQNQQKQKKRDILNKKRYFETEFFNKRFEKGKWSRFAFGKKTGYVISAEDIKECHTAFKNKYPETARNIENF